jgi:probable rRNA maturation factor
VTIAVEVENRSGFRVDADAVRRVVAGALARGGLVAGDAGVVFVDADEMAALNARHRARDEPTDVLTFPVDGRAQLPAGVPRQLGDVVVCPAVAGRDGTPIATLLVHGVLHLVGYDHEIDAGEMLARQDELAREAETVDAEPS